MGEAFSALPLPIFRSVSDAGAPVPTSETGEEEVTGKSFLSCPALFLLLFLFLAEPVRRSKRAHNPPEPRDMPVQKKRRGLLFFFSRSFSDFNFLR